MKGVSTLQIVRLPGREMESRGIAQRIERSVDLGEQAGIALRFIPAYDREYRALRETAA